VLRDSIHAVQVSCIVYAPDVYITEESIFDNHFAVLKVKFSLSMATKAQTGSRGIALLFL
jgi:hypothetical protein